MSSWFPTRIDPYAGNFVERFAHLLSDTYEVTVLHTMGDKNCSSIEVDDQQNGNLRIIRIYHHISKNRFIHWWLQRKALRKGLLMLDHIDLIFAHVFLPRAMQFARVQNYFHVPLIVMEHGSYYHKKLVKSFISLHQQLIKRGSRHTSEIVAVSNVLRSDMKPLFPTTKIQVIPNFVDEEIFTLRDNNPEKRTKFIHISTLDKNTKNPAFLFDGFLNAYLESGKKVSLTVVSDQDTDEWERWAKLNSCREAITFTGPCEWDEVSRLLKEHDALILTSEYETFSIVLAEAWLTGTPVISTPVGIAANMTDALGIKIDHNNIADLKHAILDMMNGKFQFDKELMRAFGMQFSKESVRKQLIELFNKHFIIYE
ncbi:glycosyltransferase family 4 protein [uncultured Fluviicola sp.]|uniref:glycosyltransferase family 4 protein n=1 Tax=uncultured Fluviicola sp. TaxID=463303 RepID=UPI0025E8753A|nr:glycosyltransferase family 4 protein [uncultured Fluviicola sp.]